MSVRWELSVMKTPWIWCLTQRLYYPQFIVYLLQLYCNVLHMYFVSTLAVASFADFILLQLRYYIHIYLTTKVRSRHKVTIFEKKIKLFQNKKGQKIWGTRQKGLLICQIFWPFLFWNGFKTIILTYLHVYSNANVVCEGSIKILGCVSWGQVSSTFGADALI